MRSKGVKDPHLNTSNHNRQINKTKAEMKPAESAFSLDESENKFAQLRKKLREITNSSLINKENTNKNNSQIHHDQDRGLLSSINAKVVQSKQIKPSSIAVQETERKKRSFHQQQHVDKSTKADLRDGKTLIWQKEQTLSEINRLLQLKQDCLSKIEQQLKKQMKKKFTNSSNYFSETQQLTAEKVKAPNLYQIRQEKRKLKEKADQF